jgi:hypothetical protein
MQELIRQIEGVKAKMQEMGGEFQDTATKSDKAFNESTKKVTTYFEKTRSIGKVILVMSPWNKPPRTIAS